MKVVFYLFLSILFFENIYAKDLIVDDTIKIGEVAVGETKLFEVSIKNNSDKKIKLLDYKEFDDLDYYKINFTPNSIDANNTSTFSIEVSPKQNVNSYLNLFIKYCYDDNSIQYLPIVVITNGVLQNPYYNSTQNKWGSDLYNALKDLLKNHKSFTYKQARTILWTGPDRINGSIECLYTGRTKEVADIPDFEQYDSDGFNTEHLWPRAFGADDEPELSDMFHIIPTFKTANTKRDNYPFDYVTSNVSYQDGGSKLGKNSNGDIVFEPRDISKGNVARSLFYFATRYGNIDNNLTKQEKTLREWNFKDLPDQKEINRNDSIYKYQTNRNPYIDFPQFLERMPDLSKGGGELQKKSDVFLVDTLYQIEGIVRDKELILETYLFNKGNEIATLKKIDWTYSNNHFKFDPFKTTNTLFPNAYHTTFFTFDAKSNDGKNINDTLTIKYELADGKTLSHKYVIKATINSVEEQLERDSKLLNNPSNLNHILILPETFSLINANYKLVNLEGEIILSGNLYSKEIDINKLELSLNGGTYFIIVKNNDYTITKKLIVIK